MAAGEGASIGEVYVDVLPKTDDFWARTQAQLGPQAGAVGKTIGKTIADQIAAGIRAGIGEGFKGNPGKEPGRRTGEDFAGEFDRTVRTRIQAALKALPKAEIGAATTEADQKIRDLRARLEELSTKRIGIDIDEATALGEIRGLQEELDRLARETPSVRITTDAVRAAAELQAVQVQAERLAATNPNVHIDTNAAEAAAQVESVDRAARGSSGGMSNLLAAGIALGPAIIPVAAAVAAAVAGIGVGAIAAGAGLGVAILATRGVGDAVKAMTAVDTSAAAQAAQLAQRQQQVASAANSVSSAEASLANTRASAADATRRAAETVANAQLSVAQAEQQALRAEQDLTRAREAAKRANEDLAQQVKDGALAQRQAALDVTKAELALQQVKSNPAATQLQRQEAQLTYDQAVQQVEDLGIRQDRLTKDNAAAQKAGVSGSQQVVAAQQQVAQSQDGVRKAVQSLNDARIAEATTARQNAFTIQQASQGVANAQRSLQQATVTAATAGTAANEQLRQKMSQLTPEGQRFAAFLYGIRPIWHELTGSAASGFLPGLQSGIAALLPVAPQATADIHGLALEAGHLAAAGGQAFAAPYWQSFFHLLAAQGVPAMDTGAHVAFNLALATGGLVKAILPLGQEFGGGLVNFTQRLAIAANNLESSHGFQSTLEFIRQEGPIAVHTLGDVASAAIHIVEAVAPLGGPTLTIVRALAGTINALPVSVLTAVAGGIVAITTASKLLDLTKVIKDSGAFAAGQLALGQTVSAAKTAMADAGPSAGKFATALAGIKGGAQGAASGIGGLLGQIGPGGLLIGALGVAAIGVTFFATQVAESEQRTQRLATALRALSTEYDKTHSLASQSAADVIKQNDDLAKLVLHTDKYGLSLQDVLNAAHGVPGSLEKIDAVSKHLLDTQGGLTEEQARAFKALHDVAKQSEQNSEVDRILGINQAAVTTSTYQMTAAQKALGDALNVVADSTSTAAQKADALKAADDAIFGAARAADDAQEALAAAQDRLTASVTQASNAHLTGAHSIDIHTEAGRANRDALKAQLLALDDEYFASIRNGTAVDAATVKHDQETQALLAQAKQLGLNVGDVHALVNIYGQVPTDVKTQITVAGAQEALTQLQNLEIAQLSLRTGIPVDQAAKEYQAQHKAAQKVAQGLAVGGPVAGPGGPTDDLVPAVMPWGGRLIPFRLSNDEHVWTAAEVRAAGGHAAVEALRQQVLGGRSPVARYPGDGSGGIAFARGGAVNWPYPVTALVTRIPSLAEIQRVAAFGPDYTGPVSSALSAAVAFVRAQVGKPYGWAQAGPGSYDCSGIGSAALNVARGRSPYSHTFSTADEARYFPLPGYGAFTAAWTNPGEPGPGGGANGVGHTAFRIGNYAFESVGSQGVRAGAAVTPLSSFAHLGHYDSGGVLPPGLTIAHNDTGRDEFVLTDEQLRGLGGGRAGPTIHQTINPGPEATPYEIAQMVKAELAWELR